MSEIRQARFGKGRSKNTAQRKGRKAGRSFAPPQFKLTADPVSQDQDLLPQDEQVSPEVADAANPQPEMAEAAAAPVQQRTNSAPVQQRHNPEAEEAQQHKKAPAQKKAAPDGSSATGMSAEVQGKMEHAFGEDFSGVKIHTDSNQATDMGALAYTQGNDIHFAPGQFKQDTQSGQELLGHELTHVVQQREGRVKPTTEMDGVAVNDDKGLEAEADTLGARAAQAKFAPDAHGPGCGCESCGTGTQLKKQDAVQAKLEPDAHGPGCGCESCGSRQMKKAPESGPLQAKGMAEDGMIEEEAPPQAEQEGQQEAPQMQGSEEDQEAALLAAMPEDLEQNPEQAQEAEGEQTQEQEGVQQNKMAPAASGGVVQRWGWLRRIGRAIGSGFRAVGRGIVNAGRAIGRGVRTIGRGIARGARAIGRGIVRAGGWLWDKAKKIWNGVKTGAIWAWGKVKTIGSAILKYGWKVIKAGGAAVWTFIRKAPWRLGRLLSHIGGAIPGIARWLWNGAKTLFTNPRDLGKWFMEGLKGSGAWIGRLFAKVVDMFGTGELLTFLWQIIKFNTRTLTSAEITEARKVFGNSIPYWQVRIDESSLIAKIGAWAQSSSGMGVTLFHTINFNRKIAPAPGNGDMHWLIHELCHVSQYEHVGSQYIGEAIHAQATTGYNYGGPAALAGKNFSDFNREQQADIAADYYGHCLYGSTPNTHYLPLIQQLKNGNM